MSTNNKHVDPDDFFSDTRMTFGEHIEDLRTHLIRAIKGFVICVLLSILIAKPVLAFIQAPVQRQLEAFWERYYLRKAAEPAPGRPKPSPLTHVRLQKSALMKAVGLTPKEEPLADVLPAFETVLEALDVGFLLPSEPHESSGYVRLKFRFDDMRGIGVPLGRAIKEIQPPYLTTLSVQEGFVVYFKVALMTGFVLGSPWIFTQIWLFVAAGLYPHEKKWVHWFLPFSLALFIGGVLLCELVVMDKAVEALLWFNQFLGLAPDLRLSEWLGFAIWMPLVFGISFQTPLVMLFLQRIGIVTVQGYREKWRIVYMLMAVFAAVITPSTDPFSMSLLFGPMILLYELGIWLCKVLPGRPLLEFEAPEPEEMVEV